MEFQFVTGMVCTNGVGSLMDKVEDCDVHVFPTIMVRLIVMVGDEGVFSF